MLLRSTKEHRYMIVTIGTICQSIFRHNRFSSSRVRMGGEGSASSPLYDTPCAGSGGGLTSSTLNSRSKFFSNVGLALLSPDERFMAKMRGYRELARVVVAWGEYGLVVG